MKCLSLFSGIGGFDLALKNLGHEIIGACEIDQYARQIYSRHFPGVTIHNDATTLQPESLPQFDLLCGGFPCQAFSIAGKRRGFDDCRGTMFFEIARIAKEKRPRYLLLENVRGLLSHNKGETFRTILQTLDEMGYDAEWQVINSKYFVPQNRERIFIIGHLRGERTRQVFPLGELDEETTTSELRQVGVYNKTFMRRKTEPDKSKIIQYLKDNKNFSLSEISEKTGIIKTQIEHYFRLDSSGALPDKDDWIKLKKVMMFDDTWDNIMTDYIEDESTFEISSRVYDANGISPTLEATGEKIIKLEPQLKQIGNIDSKGHNSIWGRVYDTNGISPTINSEGGGMGAKTGLYAIVNDKGDFRTVNESTCLDSNYWKGCDNHAQITMVSNGVRIRKLTPLECERLQGFPDNWTSGLSDTQRYKCIGNAVTVPVIEYIVRNIL